MAAAEIAGTSFAAERWVRVMADFSGDGVWHRDGAGGDAESLGVPEALVARLRRWQEWHDAEAWDETRDGTLDVPAFAAEGLAIARAVKAALPRFTVIYHDIGVLARRPDAARAEFEYPIT